LRLKRGDKRSFRCQLGVIGLDAILAGT
jgi:hypothetical protein